MKILVIVTTVGILLLGNAVLEVDANEDSDRQWLQNFNLHLSGSAGNTDSFDMRAGWRARQSTQRYRRLLDASYNLGTVSNDLNKSALTAGARQDWLIANSSWFGFGEGRYDFDNFRAWRHRASAHAGLGNEFKKTDTFELLGRAGVGASKQWYETQHTRPEGLLGGEMFWQMSERQEFTASSYIYPELDNVSEFRLLSKAELSMDIDRARGMSIVSGIEHDYETSAGTEFRNWDLRYYTGLSVAF